LANTVRKKELTGKYKDIIGLNFRQSRKS